MARTFKKINGRWIEDEGDSKYIQDKDTGYMQGRLGKEDRLNKTEIQKKHWAAKKDTTNVKRVLKNYSVKVKASNGRRGTVRHYKRGQIIGRI